MNIHPVKDPETHSGVKHNLGSYTRCIDLHHWQIFHRCILVILEVASPGIGWSKH
jgi:hypothetical protein